MTRWGRLLAAAVALLGASGRAASAQTSPDARLTLVFRDVPVAEALERLAAEAGLSIAWEAETLRDAPRSRVSCQSVNVAAEVVLRCIVRDAGLDFYRRSSGTYVVVAATETPMLPAALGGVITDARTGAPIPAARIRLDEAATWRVAGDDGGFAFDRLAPGRYALAVQAIGYRPARRTLELDAGGAARLLVPLEPAALLPTPIVVNGIRAGDGSRPLGTTALDGAPLAAALQAPSLFLAGTAHPLGVSRRGGTGDLHVQGGDLGEHPWYLDGVPLFDASSLSGLLGTVSPDAVGRLTVRRSGFRAAEGSHSAGAIALTHGLRDARDDDPNAVLVAADPLAVTARMQRAFGLGGARARSMLAVREGLWNVSAPAPLAAAVRAWHAPDAVLLHRVSGMAALPGMASLEGMRFDRRDERESVTLRDAHAAVSMAWPDLTSLEASAFRLGQAVGTEGMGRDAEGRALMTRDGYRWSTLGGQLTHRAWPSARVRRAVQLRAASHDLTHESAMTMQGPVSASMSGREGHRITDVGGTADWTIAGRDAWEATVGIDAGYTAASLDLANGVLRPLRAMPAVGRATLFADLQRDVSGVTLETGVRVTQLSSGRTYAEPRLAVRDAGGTDALPWAWRVAAGGYRQFVSQFDVTMAAPTAFVPHLRFWLPLDGRGPMPQAWHLAGEAVRRLAPSWEARVEAYGRWHPSIAAVDYGALFDHGPGASAVVGMDAFVADARGWAAGIGARLGYDGAVAERPLRVEVAYDGGTNRRTFPSRFGGRFVTAPWVEPHRVQVGADLSPARGWQVGVRTRAIAGRPWALRQAYYDLFGAAPDATGLPLEAPDAMRRPAIIEVDAGVRYSHRIGGVPIEAGLSVTNLLDRANVLDFGLRREAAGQYAMVPRLLPGRVPMLTVRIGP